jgi:hypothetical protein
VKRPVQPREHRLAPKKAMERIETLVVRGGTRWVRALGSHLALLVICRAVKASKLGGASYPYENAAIVPGEPNGFAWLGQIIWLGRLVDVAGTHIEWIAAGIAATAIVTLCCGIPTYVRHRTVRGNFLRLRRNPGKPRVREKVHRSLLKISKKESIPELLDWLQDDDSTSEMKDMATQILMRIANLDLIQCLVHHYPCSFKAIWIALRRPEIEKTQIVDMYVKALSSGQHGIRSNAASVLADMEDGSAIIPLFECLVKEHHESARRAIGAALMGFGSTAITKVATEETISHLLFWMDGEDSTEEMKKMIAQSLADLGDKEALLHLLKRWPQFATRATLTALGNSGAAQCDITLGFVQALRFGENDVRIQAAKSLADMQDDVAVAALSRQLGEK